MTFLLLNIIYFSDVFLDALEEVALANAIIEGRKNDFVSEANIFLLLES